MATKTGSNRATKAGAREKRKAAPKSPKIIMMQPMLAAAWVPIIAPATARSLESTSAAPTRGFEGFSDSLESVRHELESALKNFLSGIKTAIEDAATLEVRTFVSGSVETLRLEAGRIPLDQAQLRAFTVIRLDGDIDICVPMQADQIDRSLWDIHTMMVAQAQANRTELIKLAATAASGILNVIKPV